MVEHQFAGALGPLAGVSRRYDGPMGKSDRALVFGGFALAVGMQIPLPPWAGWLMPALAALLCLTIFNRIRAGLREAASATVSAASVSSVSSVSSGVNEPATGDHLP